MSTKMSERLAKRMTRRQEDVPMSDEAFEAAENRKKDENRAACGFRRLETDPSQRSSIDGTGTGPVAQFSQETSEERILAAMTDYQRSLVDKARETTSKEFLDVFQITEIVEILLSTFLSGKDSGAQIDPDQMDEDAVKEHLEQLEALGPEQTLNEVVLIDPVVEGDLG